MVVENKATRCIGLFGVSGHAEAPRHPPRGIVDLVLDDHGALSSCCLVDK